MCQIAVCEKRRLLTKEIEEYWSGNSDGAGIAWIGKGRVHYRKGIMEEKELLRLYKTNIPLPHVVHFRLASVGGKCKELTHPFTIEHQFNFTTSGVTDRVLFHNGTIHDYQNYLILLCLTKDVSCPKHVSDTAVAAILAHYAGENILTAISGHSRFAVVSGQGIKLYGDFKEKDGILLSSFRAVTKFGSIDSPYFSTTRKLWPEDSEL